MHLSPIHSLGANLCEITASLYAHNENKPFSIYATSDSTVVFEGSLLGQAFVAGHRLWKKMQLLKSHAFIDTLSYILTTQFDHSVHHIYDARQQRIWNVMRQIDLTWNNQEFSEQRNRYKNFLTKELRGSPESNSSIYLADFDRRRKTLQTDSEVRKHRHRVVSFQQNVQSFWTLFVANDAVSARLRKPLECFLATTSLLKDGIIYQAIKREGMWIKLEGIMELPIPVALLSKVHTPSLLTEDENNCLSIWVKALNEQQEKISPKLLATVLDEVIAIIRLQGTSEIVLQDVLYWLNTKKCALMKQEDFSHTNWREGLKLGDSVICNGVELVLDKQIGANDADEDIHKVFALRDYPEYVIKIAHNRFLLLLEEKQSSLEAEHWGVRYVQTILTLGDKNVSGLDTQGKCVVLEKLYSPFGEHEWTSKTIKLNERDELLSLQFTNHIFCMSQWKATPSNLSFMALMQNKEGVLKSTKLLKKMPPNYNEWEDLCVRAAKDNIHVLRFMMNVSKLQRHKVANYYRNAVTHALQTGKTDLIGRQAPVGYRLQIYEKHVEELCLQAIESKKSCVKKVIRFLQKKKQYKESKREQIERDVGIKLVHVYLQHPTPGHLPLHLKQEAFDSYVALNSSLDSEAMTFEEEQEYYTAKHELMMRYNTEQLQ